jgi:hypothetical protein
MEQLSATLVSIIPSIGIGNIGNLGLFFFRQGANDAGILENIVGLTPDDLETTEDYYRRNPAEIDEAIRVNEKP